ncbi:MAG: hypothetical protein LAKADJCE_00640 [Candidatus Argoarchaeum ethanivorans]|uniref:Uncharacterized protein n=1 Tax=Candidatus Argoarchaeum ethanivorans TaxID=2608793 RepID=A0A811TEH7_9EURY|nr:MAG: hypothetical protein LAKADJCE_00640 [Candidatus Argoarchaeum ethanivorans]
MSKTKIKLRKHLNADELFGNVHSGFDRILDRRSNNIRTPPHVTLISAPHTKLTITKYFDKYLHKPA